jgi:phospholipid/cholesterol/gamma-HCH transport system substrate-binding protein
VRRIAGILVCVIGLAVAVPLLLTSASRGAGAVYQVRAIFDNAAFAVPGEDVRIAGAPIGSIKSLDVTPDKKAAVTISINNAAFTPFYRNATCAIRPQSLIGERYVDCNPGSSNEGRLSRITSGPGSGSYLLPLARTSSPVDSDIVQGIYQQPIRERFALILNELGTGLAARGSDLNDVIHRANPALGYTDQVIKILARQNKQLAQLARDSDTVLAPLANARRSLSDFVVQANTTSVASAARATDIARSFQLFPSFLRQLNPLLVDLGKLTDQGTPLMASLGQSAAALSRQFRNLTPFANAARPALIALGKSSQQSEPALVATIPLAKRLKRLGDQAVPSATLLDRLTASLDHTGAIEDLMSLLFNGTGVGNGFDSFGHYVRTDALVGDCTGYAQKPVLGCEANFSKAGATPASAQAASKSQKTTARAAKVNWVVHQAAQRAAGQKPDDLKGLLSYLIGNGR